MNKYEQLKTLTNTLNDQVLECEKTMRKISSLVKECEDNQLKFYALTEIETPHFGGNSLGRKVDKLKKYLKDK